MIRKLRISCLIACFLAISSSWIFGSSIDPKLGLVYRNGKLTGIDPDKLQFPNWRYAEHLISKNTAPILKEGELEWGADSFEVVETGIDGSTDPQARRRKFFHKLEKQQSFISLDGKNWFPLNIKILNKKPTKVKRFLMRVMVIQLSSDIFSAAYDVFDYHYGHEKHR
mgnify:CR=1 FL=1